MWSSLLIPLFIFFHRDLFGGDYLFHFPFFLSKTYLEVNILLSISNFYIETYKAVNPFWTLNPKVFMFTLIKEIYYFISHFVNEESF